MVANYHGPKNPPPKFEPMKIKRAQRDKFKINLNIWMTKKLDFALICLTFSNKLFCPINIEMR
jgi:hypothetical protein